jgi:hypothetical protein
VLRDLKKRLGDEYGNFDFAVNQVRQNGRTMGFGVDIHLRTSSAKARLQSSGLKDESKHLTRNNRTGF